MPPTIFQINPAKNQKAQNIIKKTKQELERFFGIKITEPRVIFINSRKNFDLIAGRKTEDWETGRSEGKNIFIFSPQKYTKESSHKDSNDFWLTLKHEYCHIAFREFCGHSRPKWLNEGLACYLAKQTKKIPKEKTTLKILSYYNQADWLVYQAGYFWVKVLLKIFGKKKLLQLAKSINSSSTESDFAKVFYKIYKIKFDRQGLGQFIKKNTLI